MSVLFPDEAEDPRSVSGDLVEAAVAEFEERLHPRNRLGEFRPGDLVHQKGYKDPFKVVGHWRGNVRLEHMATGTTHHAMPGELTHAPGQQRVIVHDRPQKAMFERGDRVILKDGREGTVMHASGGKRFGGFSGSDTWEEPRYTVSTQKPEKGSKGYLAEEVNFGGEKMSRARMIEELQRTAKAQFPNDSKQAQAVVDRHMQGYEHRGGQYEQVQADHGDLAYHPDELAKRREGIAAAQEKAAAGKYPARTLPVRRLPVTLGPRVVPDEWQVEHGYAEWGSSLRPIFAEGGRTRVGHEEEKFARMKPGVNVERMIAHYLIGHEPPANFPEGTQAHAQWTYTGTGGKKADREALLRKITQALDARARGYDALYFECLEEACLIREGCGPLEHELQEAEFPFVEGVYDEAKHPRGRAGKFREVSFHIHVQGRKTQVTGHDLGNGLAVVHRTNANSSLPEHQIYHVGTGMGVGAIGDHGEDREHVREVLSQHFAGGTDHSGKSVDELRTDAALKAKRDSLHKVAESFRKSRAQKAGRRERSDEQDARWRSRIGECDLLFESEADEIRKIVASFKVPCDCGADNLPHEHGSACPKVPVKVEESAMGALWDEALHPRGRGGRFRDVLASLKMNGHANLGHGVRLERGRIAGYKLHTPEGKPQHFMDAEQAVTHAISAHLDGARKEQGKFFLARYSPGERVSVTMGGQTYTGSPDILHVSNEVYFGQPERSAVHRALQRQEVDGINRQPVGLPGGEPRATGAQVSAASGRANRRFAKIERDVLGGKHLHQAMVDHGLASDLEHARGILSGTRSADFPPVNVNSSRERGLAQIESERRTDRPKIRPEDRSFSKAQALVDSGLADDLADARAQLADMGEGGRASPAGHTFYREAKSGDRVWVSPGSVKIERTTHTTNPHQPARKWYVTARPNDHESYAAKKVASGDWVPEESRGMASPGRAMPTMGQMLMNRPERAASPVSAAKVALGNSRIDVMDRIVDRHQAEEVDGILVDVQTANLLRQIHSGLRPENRDRFEKMPMARLADVAWQSVR